MLVSGRLVSYLEINRKKPVPCSSLLRHLQAADAAREEWKEKMEAFKSAGGVVPKRAPPGTRAPWRDGYFFLLSGVVVIFWRFKLYDWL